MSVITIGAVLLFAAVVFCASWSSVLTEKVNCAQVISLNFTSPIPPSDVQLLGEGEKGYWLALYQYKSMTKLSRNRQEIQIDR